MGPAGADGGARPRRRPAAGAHVRRVDGPALALLDVGSGERYALPTRVADTWRGPAAFFPDGRRLAVQDGTALTVVDVTERSQRTLADLGPRRRLAGPGAWTPDARRVAVFDLDGCLDDCTGTALDERTHRVAYLDPDTGAATPGPALEAVRGFTARLLGWQRDGDAVVGLHHARPGAEPRSEYPGGHERNFWAYGRVELLALYPGGGRTALVDLPADASHVEVALDLLTTDRFGGASAPLHRRLLDLDWPLLGLLGLLVAAVVGLPLAVRRIRRTRAATAH